MERQQSCDRGLHTSFHWAVSRWSSSSCIRCPKNYNLLQNCLCCMRPKHMRSGLPWHKGLRSCGSIHTASGPLTGNTWSYSLPYTAALCSATTREHLLVQHQQFHVGTVYIYRKEKRRDKLPATATAFVMWPYGAWPTLVLIVPMSPCLAVWATASDGLPDFLHSGQQCLNTSLRS